MFINFPTGPPPDLPGRLTFLIAALLRACGAHIVKDRTAGPWLVLVWNRMNGISQRVQWLAAQIQAGTVPPLKAGFTLTKPRKPPTKPPLRLPSNPMWLIDVIQPTAVYGVWLQQILADPEMPALLAAAPQLACILRPLCRALGVAPLPPRPQRPASPTAPTVPDTPLPEAGQARAVRAGSSPSPRAGLDCAADQGRGEGSAAGTQSLAPPHPTPLCCAAKGRPQRAPAVVADPAHLRAGATAAAGSPAPAPR